MKKVILIVGVLVSSLSISFGGEGDKIKIVSNDSTSSKINFNVHSNGENRITVELENVDDEMSSISLIDQKGESYSYHFIKQSNETVEIDTSNIKAGLYYVKLNLNGEIRMKLVVIK